ncbi:molybdenum cofactor guanylyltransferase [Methylomonas paludis]|uniref:Molybdenum cofactor guanylyltransferase n=1 Tax=Methylomonas paludis TaxID=1173101 RepID=A0A975ML12_9GAMM|nr:molybdenum cofactor guanylyltransferase MobA [Methylomonas paludis]QWF69781.1 molybdenum cofactor guanylyltransferase [Methylomonas paludis]
MSGQNKVSGVVLAGGQARRMHRQDKGLVLFKRRPLISSALAAMSPLVDELFISANRNQQTYQQLGYPVISDLTQSFDGPLAGILAAMQTAQYPVLLVMPCDSPFIETRHLQRLLAALTIGYDISVADDGERLHPVFLAVRSQLQTSLHHYLAGGERKLQNWLQQHSVQRVDFSAEPQIFANINTLTELAAWQQKPD